MQTLLKVRIYYVGTGVICQKLFCQISRYSCESQDSFGGGLKFLRLSGSVVQDPFFDHIYIILTEEIVTLHH